MLTDRQKTIFGHCWTINNSHLRHFFLLIFWCSNVALCMYFQRTALHLINPKTHWCHLSCVRMPAPYYFLCANAHTRLAMTHHSTSHPCCISIGFFSLRVNGCSVHQRTSEGNRITGNDALPPVCVRGGTWHVSYDVFCRYGAGVFWA